MTWLVASFPGSLVGRAWERGYMTSTCICTLWYRNKEKSRVSKFKVQRLNYHRICLRCSYQDKTSIAHGHSTRERERAPMGWAPYKSANWGVGHLDIVKFCIEELKCPPDIIGHQNTTPLQMARHENHLVIVQYLQKRSVIPYIYTALFVLERLGFL